MCEGLAGGGSDHQKRVIESVVDALNGLLARTEA
jgi:hypothetical protein